MECRLRVDWSPPGWCSPSEFFRCTLLLSPWPPRPSMIILTLRESRALEISDGFFL